ncbi:MAG: creatininase family protein [Methylocystis sp.]
MSSPYWCDLKTTDFAALDWASTIVVAPIAAIEQHGPHLPLGVDAMIMDGMIARVAPLLPAAPRVLFLPTQSVGVSTEHRDFAGTLSLRPSTALAMLAELLEGPVATGAKKLVILNSHGGNSALVTQAALDLRARHGVLAVTCSFARFGYPPGLFEAVELRHGIHGGAVETSIMLHLRPDLVDMGRARNFSVATQDFARDFKWLSADRPAGFGWMAQDLSKDGAMGDATAASAQKGEAVAEFWARAFVELIQEADAFALARLQPRV